MKNANNNGQDIWGGRKWGYVLQWIDVCYKESIMVIIFGCNNRKIN